MYDSLRDLYLETPTFPEWERISREEEFSARDLQFRQRTQTDTLSKTD